MVGGRTHARPTTAQHETSGGDPKPHKARLKLQALKATTATRHNNTLKTQSRQALCILKALTHKKMPENQAATMAQ